MSSKPICFQLLRELLLPSLESYGCKHKNLLVMHSPLESIYRALFGCHEHFLKYRAFQLRSNPLRQSRTLTLNLNQQSRSRQYEAI
jgi:hypothetical protein